MDRSINPPWVVRAPDQVRLGRCLPILLRLVRYAAAKIRASWPASSESTTTCSGFVMPIPERSTKTIQNKDSSASSRTTPNLCTEFFRGSRQTYRAIVRSHGRTAPEQLQPDMPRVRSLQPGFDQSVNIKRKDKRPFLNFLWSHGASAMQGRCQPGKSIYGSIDLSIYSARPEPRPID